MSGDESGVVGITGRELLVEMHDDIRALRSVVDSVAHDQALSVERRASIGRVADTITARLDSHEQAILDLQRWRDQAAGAIRLARWALGASLVASVPMVLQIDIAAWIATTERLDREESQPPPRRPRLSR